MRMWVSHREQKSTTLNISRDNSEHKKVTAIMGGIKINWVASILLSVVIFVALTDSATAKEYPGSIDETIPPVMDVPLGNEIQKLLFGTGVQVYTNTGPGDWVLTNVKADLYDFQGQKVGLHYFIVEKDKKGGQPTWETLEPYSLVTCKSVESVDSPTGDAIAWLLLEMTENYGSGKLFGSTTFVQMIYTHHGLPPAANFPAVRGQIFESSYTALYKFSKKK